MTPFAAIRDRAHARHGDTLADRFPAVRDPAALAATPDAAFLAAMTRRVFAAGFRWRVIVSKWDGFEAAFHDFDPAWVAALDDEGVDTLATDTRIVRNRPKIVATVHNAGFVSEVAAEHGTFGAWLAAWPASDTIGLWKALKQRGSRLGGDTGAWFLRDVGRDTFRLSHDVIAALIDAGVVRRPPSTRAELAAVDAAFTAWSAESGLSLGAVSVVLACSVGEIYGP